MEPPKNPELRRLSEQAEAVLCARTSASSRSISGEGNPSAQSAEEFAEASACGFARDAASDALAYLATGYSIEVAQVFRKGVEEAAGFAKCHCLPFCRWSFYRACESEFIRKSPSVLRISASLAADRIINYD